MKSTLTRCPTVYMDVDGILADLWGTLYKAHGKVYSPDNPECPKGEIGYYVSEVFGISWEALWVPYAEELVTNMDKLPEADEIMRIADEKDRTWNLVFLTSLLPNRLNGRYEWLKKYYPNIPVIIADVKSFCCSGPESLLIDDFDQNIRAWHRWGGRTIHFPRRWNSRCDEIEGYFPNKFVEDFECWKSDMKL